ncbi:hypothetical protein [Candidatus Palauibacter soopunensis]|uniref:hypothetical protein n=1 Tax=Candidatus Palauibacter soopunensis TaxID=3056739 RepID=UPI00238B90DD|nr:hypothetical protein [Candidatus Palauibacter soopunensis]MDE2879961.1 hypothetical protein [Candidatus Palauibacter soopunensis]
MSTSSRAVAVIGGLCLLIAASGGPRDASDEASELTAARTGAVPHWFAATPSRIEPGVLEARRIAGHLRDVEGVLRRRSTDGLSAAQRERRSTALDWLREYRERGEFPHNHTHAAGRVPVFVDEHGTPCAVAYLLQRSGRENLVREIASADNNVYAWELADDGRFSEWLDDMGLTLEEAARIQPGYADYCLCIVDEASRVWRYVTPFTLGSVVAGYVVNGATQPEAWERTAVGALNGAFAVAHAALAVNAAREWQDSSIGARGSTIANSALALVSGYVAWSFLRPRPDEPSTVETGLEAPSALRSHRPRFLAPSAAWVGGGLGLQVRLVH